MKALLVGVLVNADKSVYGFRVFKLTDTFHKIRKDKQSLFCDYSMYSLVNAVKSGELEVINMEIVESGINITDGNAEDLPRYLKDSFECVGNQGMNIVLCRVVLKQKTVGYVVLETTGNYSYIKEERMLPLLKKHRWYNIQKSEKHVRGKRGNLYVQDHDALDKKRAAAKKEKAQAIKERKAAEKQKVKERKEKQRQKEAELAEKLALEQEKVKALQSAKGAAVPMRSRKDIPQGNVIPVKVVPTLNFTAADLHRNDIVKTVKKSNKDLKSSFLTDVGVVFATDSERYVADMDISAYHKEFLYSLASSGLGGIAEGRIICANYSEVTGEVISADYVGKRGALQRKVSKATLLNDNAHNKIENIVSEAEEVKTGKDIVLKGGVSAKLLDTSGVDGMYDVLGNVKIIPCTAKLDRIIGTHYYSNLDEDDLGYIFDYLNNLIFASHEMGRLPKVPVVFGDRAGVAVVIKNTVTDARCCGRAAIKVSTEYSAPVSAIVMPYIIRNRTFYETFLGLMLHLMGTLTANQFAVFQKLIQDKTGICVPSIAPHIYYWCPVCKHIDKHSAQCSYCAAQKVHEGGIIKWVQ